MKLEEILSESQTRFREKLLISKSGFMKSLARHAANIYSLHLMVIEVEQEYDLAVENLKSMERTLRRARRRKLKMEKDKISESQIDEEVKSHAEYTELKAVVMDLNKTVKQIKAKYTSMILKGKMMEQYGHMTRREQEAEKASLKKGVQ